MLSGAGISAESGVPTFRDDETGLWAQYDPYEISSTDGWQKHPERVWAWYLWRHHLVKEVAPNDGHRAVAAWQDYAEVTVVTQNVDDLHERAGSKTVHHLHGSLAEFWCDTCGSRYHGPLPDMAEPVLEKTPPSCECGGLIRPGIVWFGEQLPDEPWQAAVAAVASADIVVVVGTSGIVYPAAGLPEIALARGAVVIEVNPEPTPLSESATASIRESAGTALPALLPRLPALLEEQPRSTARPTATSDTGIGTQAGNVIWWRVASTLNPAAVMARSVLRWVWQLPAIRGHTVASATRCTAPRHPGLATCSKNRNSPPGLSTEFNCRRTSSGSSTEHSTSEQTTASNGSAGGMASMVDSITVTGTVAADAASPARGASRVSGSSATTSVTVAG